MAATRTIAKAVLLLLGLIQPGIGLGAQTPRVPTPSEHLGFEVGADRQLADYEQVVSYFRKLDEASDRLDLEDLGPTTQGRPLIQAVISSEDNLKNKRKYQEIARKLADPRGLSSSEIDKLVSEGKAIVLVTCNIHASEIGATQMAMEWAHSLVTAEDEETSRLLSNVILLLAPSINPDGMTMEVQWYRKYLGTPFEGGRMPWLYHQYVGHDNNRDWFMLTQKETLAVNRMVYFEWFPQVWLDEHQMGTTGPRMFVPPYSSPVADRLHPLLWRTVDHIGTLMSWRLEEQKKAGVIYGYTFDAYWPGGTKNTAWWKNIAGLLTEVASTRMGTPVDVAAGELQGGSKGLPEYRKQTNFPNPWPGGTWRLRDIMDYERIASDALLEACSTNREAILRGRLRMAAEATAAGKPSEYYRVALDQRDPVTAARLAHLIAENGAEVLWSARDKAFFIPTAQPLGLFVTEVLSTQRYPKVRTSAGGDYMLPYDVTAWSLPLMMGVAVEKTTQPADRAGQLRPIRRESDWPEGGLDREAGFYAVAHSANNVTLLINELLKRGRPVTLARSSFTGPDGTVFPPGSVLLEASPDLGEVSKSLHLPLKGLSQRPAVPSDAMRAPRVALYKPWTASMDEGWTRWLLERYRFDPANIDNQAFKSGAFGDFDVVVLPDVHKDVIVDGRRKPEEGALKYFQELPPEYAGGIGKDGAKSLKQFVEKGGTLVALASACEFVMDEFNVPVVNALPGRRSDFSCPGSLLRIQVDPTHPVTYGMPDEAAAFVNQALALRTAPSGPELSKEVLAVYPDEAEDILLSGWIQGADKLEKRAAAVALTYGKGKVVLFAFRVQQRAQMEGTFKMLFNALHWATMSEQQSTARTD